MNRVPRKSRAQWQTLVKEQAQSGLSIPDFCREHGLTENRLRKWQSKFRQETKGFARVSVKAPTTPCKIRCILPSGLRFEWDETASLDRLLPIIKGLS